jgi:hypothetical protein|tara:strand:- start:383 stop:829 length:447 start_codon:yes stop_codon:yes gene_type:complete
MSWQMAVVGALGAAQYKQQGAYGKFNQSVQNRNAQVAEQQGQILDDKLTLDLSSFDKKFRELQGQVVVNTAKSGVTQGGTAARIRLSNLYEAELEKDKMRYDTEIGKARAFEDANFSRIKGQMVRQEAKTAQLKTLTSTGTSLLQMKG